VNAIAKKLSLLALLFAVVATQSASACATCYGASDSPLAQGMNWGIMVLLGFISMVLLGVSAFFIYIVRRANALAATPPQLISTETKQ
jgi:heme/copper-type cytochrome/quinol oxidase subunit 2